MDLDDPATALHFGVDEGKQVGQGPVLNLAFFEGEHFVFCGRQRIAGQFDISQIVVDPVYTVFIQDSDEMRQEIGAPARAGRRTPRIMVVEFNQVLVSGPLLPKIWVSSLEEAAGDVYDHPHAALMHHFHKTAETTRIERSKLVRSKEPLGVIPFFMKLDHTDALFLEFIEFMRIPVVNFPRLAARVFTQVIRALAGKITGDQMFSQTPVNSPFTDRDVLKSPPVIGSSVILQQRRGVSGGFDKRRADG